MRFLKNFYNRLQRRLHSIDVMPLPSQSLRSYRIIRSSGLRSFNPNCTNALKVSSARPESAGKGRWNSSRRSSYFDPLADMVCP